MTYSSSSLITVYIGFKRFYQHSTSKLSVFVAACQCCCWVFDVRSSQGNIVHYCSYLTLTVCVCVSVCLSVCVDIGVLKLCFGHFISHCHLV